MLALFANSVWSIENDFTVDTIGVSNNTNTIFIETVESIPGSNCPVKNLFRLPDTDKQADRLFSLAMAAQAQGKKLTLGYNANDCLGSGSLVTVFKLKRDA